MQAGARASFYFSLDDFHRCSLFVFGDTVLDPRRRELRRAGVLVEMEPQVFDLIEHLVRCRDRVVTKGELLASVWRGRVISDSTIDVRINAARRAIGDTGRDQRFIRTFPRKGFRFIAPVREELAGAAAQPVGVQELSFCRTSDGVRIAVATAGSGPVLVRTATWLNHLEYEWQSPIRQPLLRFLCNRYRVVRYDGRGNGLSDWDATDLSFEGFLRDLEAAVDSLGLQRYALMGISQGAAIALAHAVRYPERVTGLVLHGAYAVGRARRACPGEKETADALIAIMRRGWGDEGSAFLRAFSALYVPGGSGAEIGWFAELQRKATSPQNAVRLRAACDDIDVAAILAHVHAPTLVLHSRRDGVVPFEEGRRLAAAIPGARFVPLDSENHILLEGEAAWRTFTGEIDAFLSGQEKP